METKGLFSLTTPIKVNGKLVHGINYDYDALTVEDIVALNRGREKVGLGVTVTPELDLFCQFALFKHAVMAADSSIDEHDLSRLSAKDGAKAARLSRDFFLEGETSEDSDIVEERTSDE